MPQASTETPLDVKDHSGRAGGTQQAQSPERWPGRGRGGKAGPPDERQQRGRGYEVEESEPEISGDSNSQVGTSVISSHP